MPAKLTEVRQALAEAMNLPDLIRYAFQADNPETPCAMVQGPDEIEFDKTYGRGSDRFVIPILILGGRAADADVSCEVVDQYLDGEGDRSLKTALEVDETLGGVVSSLRVVGARDYGQVTLEEGGIVYLGAQLIVEVYA